MFNGGLNAYKKSLTDKEAKKKYAEGWDRIFGKKKKAKNK
jgi:hypothetical protein